MIDNKLLRQLAERWATPHLRIEDTFNIRDSRGNIMPLVVPEPQREIVDSGILGEARSLVDKGIVYRRIIDKGRQIGYSIIGAAEAILIAQDYPTTFQYYVATRGEQAASWLGKVDQLVKDANNYPPSLGGGPILNITNMKPVMSKVINNCTITGFAANPAGMRGDSAINCILDEYAWMIMRKNQQHETYTAIKYFLRQGGQLTIQSTPRTSTDMFMDMYTHPDKYGFNPFYKPVITNWKDLDINIPLHIELDNKRREMFGLRKLEQKEIDKFRERFLKHPLFVYDEETQVLRQKYDIPYPWVNPIELEKDRYSDVEIFKQENLGMAIDERYKVLRGEWIYQNLSEGEDWENRRDSYNTFAFGVDIAKMRDLFIITVIEEIGTECFVRKIEIMPPGQNYNISAQRLATLFDAFRPTRISVDATGGGIPFCDSLDTISRMRPFLRRVTFSNSVKENLAENLKAVCQDGKFHMLNYNEAHQTVIKHLLKVEKQELESSTRYTGKGVDQEGRDDGFWSVALAVCKNPEGSKNMQKPYVQIKSRVGKWGDASGGSGQRTQLGSYENISKMLRGKVEKKVGEEVKVYRNIQKFKQVFNELQKGVIPCGEKVKIIKPIECVGCDKKDCVDWRVHSGIMKKAGITIAEFKEWLDEK